MLLAKKMLVQCCVLWLLLKRHLPCFFVFPLLMRHPSIPFTRAGGVRFGAQGSEMGCQASSFVFGAWLGLRM